MSREVVGRWSRGSGRRRPERREVRGGHAARRSPVPHGPRPEPRAAACDARGGGRARDRRVQRQRRRAGLARRGRHAALGPAAARAPLAARLLPPQDAAHRRRPGPRRLPRRSRRVSERHHRICEGSVQCYREPRSRSIPGPIACVEAT